MSEAFASHPTERHEVLVTYEGPSHPLQPSASRKTFCITLSQDVSHDEGPPSSHISKQDVLHSLATQIGWPSSILCLRHTAPKLLPTHSIQCGTQIVHQHAHLTATIHPRHTGILGGKGGFGTLLKGQSKQAGARQTLDFGACRDLSGRRLRHINDEIKLRKFHALQEARERGDHVDELAALKTESGIRNWHLMVPNWSDGSSMSKKGRRKHDRQLEREVRGWKSQEERLQRQKEQKRMDEEWAVNEYVKRGEVEAGRVSNRDAVKEGMLAQLRKKREEKRLLGQQSKTTMAEGVPQEDSAVTFTPSCKDSGAITQPASHLMTLSGEVSVLDIPDNKRQPSLRLQSQSDFATVVVLLNKDKVASSPEAKTHGICIEYTIQSAGLAQIGWICSPEPKSDGCPQFLPNSDTGDGVGDDAASFGYDGSRGLKFHDGEELPYGQNHRWKTGDTLGCWCKLTEKTQTIEFGYTLNTVDLGVAFTVSNSCDNLSRYFPAVSLNLGEVVDMQFESDSAVNGCMGVASFIAVEDEISSRNDVVSDDVSDDAPVDENSSSPPKKKPREEKPDLERDLAVVKKSEIEDAPISFDLNSCESIDELLAMDPNTLKNILLSMGVKCGGTTNERAERLFSLKGLNRQDYPKKVRGKNFVL